MSSKWRVGLAVLAFSMLLLARPVLAVQAGITLDVHQEILDPGLWPNDFHIEGLICSNDGTVPVLIDHIDDVFTHFTYTVTKMPGNDCWYWFEATWWLDPGQYIQYCDVLHLGVLFDVEAANVVIDLVGWWTRDGVPVGHMYGGLNNSGYVPVIGFNVADTASPQILTLGNGDLTTTPTLPMPPINPPPWPPDPMPLTAVQVEVAWFPPGMPPEFREMWEFGQQQTWDWIAVTFDDGTPISRQRPLNWNIDSFFDIFLDVPPPPGSGNLGVQFPFQIPAGGFLVSRQLVGFFNNSTREYEERWFWEVHGAEPTGACCYGGVAIQCVVTTEAICQQMYLGQWKGAGTNCDDLNGNTIADVCEELQIPEACCFSDGTCQMLPPQQCLAMLGIPKGAGSQCLGDRNGNNVDDICETKWLQLPDLEETGIDVKATKPLILADDFLCTQQSLITEIIVWGSWRGDIFPDDPTQVKFTLSLHADIPDPDGSGPAYSMPGSVLWYRDFLPGTFQATLYRGGILEGWWDPSIPTSYIFPGDTQCWMYYFPIPASQAFCQQGSPQEPIVYWLDVQAQPMGPVAAEFGWKTSTTHWNDDATWGMGSEPYPGPWQELRYPPGHQYHPESLDLAFALGEGEPCQQTEACCLPDGTCLDVLPVTCVSVYQGLPMGPGSTCAALSPTILVQPVGGWVCEKGTLTLSVRACGIAPLMYQWHKNGLNVGGNSPTLIIPNVTIADAGVYDVTVTDGAGTVVTSLLAPVVVYRKADSNCDGIIDNFDINPFVLALTNPAGWQATYPCDYLCANDINGDGVVDNFDINPFVTCLVNGGCP